MEGKGGAGVEGSVGKGRGAGEAIHGVGVEGGQRLRRSIVFDADAGAVLWLCVLFVRFWCLCACFCVCFV